MPEHLTNRNYLGIPEDAAEPTRNLCNPWAELKDKLGDRLLGSERLLQQVSPRHNYRWLGQRGGEIN